MRFKIKHGEVVSETPSLMDYGRTWIGVEADDVAAALWAVRWADAQRRAGNWLASKTPPNGARFLSLSQAVHVGKSADELRAALEENQAQQDDLADEARHLAEALSVVEDEEAEAATEAQPEDDRDPPRFDEGAVPLSECRVQR